MFKNKEPRDVAVASSRRLGNKSGAKHSGLGPLLNAALAALLVITIAEAPTVSANGVDGEYYLEGIGYRE